MESTRELQKIRKRQAGVSAASLATGVKVTKLEEALEDVSSTVLFLLMQNFNLYSLHGVMLNAPFLDRLSIRLVITNL